MLISIYIDGKKYIVEDSKNILEVCLSLGFNVPYFCWHPALGSVGSCRQCVVKLCSENSERHAASLVMSCMTPVSEGISIIITDDEVKKFQKTILELLMINHPHDCPVCEEGGNCHLQDMVVMFGKTYRRYMYTKRTHYNQYLGPFISHEMNRCITCYRCIRYYKDYAGGSDLDVFGVHDNIYFGRFKDGMLESEFSGNLIEVCPTGVFTDKTHSKNYVRKWDTLFAPSVCHQCGVGCNIILGERYGKLCRLENRYNGSVNGYFLCDRGRFGHDYIHFNDRPNRPLKKIRNNDSWVVFDKQETIADVVRILKDCGKVIGIGSTRASVESNFALRRLVGEQNFYSGISSCEQERLSLILQVLCSGNIHIPSLSEVESYDVILILGEDLTQTAARIALSVRQAVKEKARQMVKKLGMFDWQSAAVSNIAQNVDYSLLITNTDKTKLDDIAVFKYYDSVKNQARFGFAIAHALDNTAPAVKDFDVTFNDKLNFVVQKLLEARKPLIISGNSAGSKELIASAANIAYALKRRGSEVGINFIVNDVNSMGLMMIEGDKSIDDAFTEICDQKDNSISVGLVVLEHDLYRHAQERRVNYALNKVNYFVVLDHQCNVIQKKSDLVIPVTNFVESNGTVVNYEGRAQRFFRLYNPNYYNKDNLVLESWRWLYLIHDFYTDYDRKESLHIDCVINDVVDCFPKFVGIKKAAPDSSFRMHGQKLASSPHRYSGRTAYIDINNICCVPKDNETMFSFSMEGNHGVHSPHKQIAFAWVPGWNSPQAWNKFQAEIGGNLLFGDPGICMFAQHDDIKFHWFDIIPSDVGVSGNRNLNRWTIVPYWHLFGSDETSQRSFLIKNCMLKSYVMINPVDAEKLHLTQDMLLQFICVGQVLRLPIVFSNNLVVGHIGLPMGFPEIPIFFSGMYAHSLKGVICNA